MRYLSLRDSGALANPPHATRQDLFPDTITHGQKNAQGKPFSPHQHSWGKWPMKQRKGYGEVVFKVVSKWGRLQRGSFRISASQWSNRLRRKLLFGSSQANTAAWAIEGRPTSSESHVVASPPNNSRSLARLARKIVLLRVFQGQTTPGNPLSRKYFGTGQWACYAVIPGGIMSRGNFSRARWVLYGDTLLAGPAPWVPVLGRPYWGPSAEAFGP